MRKELLLISAGLCVAAASFARTWTDAQGRKIDAEFGGAAGDNVKLKMPDGREVEYPLAKLSASDQAFVKEQTKPAARTETSGGFVPRDLTPDYSKVRSARGSPPLDKRMWPLMVVMGQNLSVPKQVASTPSSATYRLGSFQFETGPDLTAPLVKEVARVFAGAEELFQRLPWDLPPTPPETTGHFTAKLYPSMADYEKVAPSMSGGFYSLTDKIFHVPYESLGMTRDSKGRWSKTKAFNPDTLMHELTHMMMDRVLPALPIWVAEGSAEYVETIPLTDGALKLGDLPKAMKGYISEMEGFQKRIRSARYKYRASTSGLLNVLHITHKAWEASVAAGQMKKPGPPAGTVPAEPSSRPEGGAKSGTGAGPTPPQPVSVNLMPTADRAAVQHDLYMHSCLLFFYFMHLDNPAQRGDPMLPYLDTAREFTEQIQLFLKAENEFRKDIAAYRKAWEDFSNLPGVKKNDDNSITFPSHMTPPKPPVEPRPPVDLDKLPDKDVSMANLDILIKGRTDDQLAKAFRDGFAKIGITIE